MPQMHLANPNAVIGDIEALLMKAMALRNKSNMNFTNVPKWTKSDTMIEKYCR